MIGRVGLFLGTNFAVMIVMGMIMTALQMAGVFGEDGTALSWLPLIIMCGLFGFVGSFISLAMSKGAALRSTGAKVITNPSNEVEHWLVNTVRAQAQAAGIGMPDVAIYGAPEPNAFATGMKKNSALVAVSAGLMNGMTREEVEAVLAHEVSHVANGDMVTLTLIQGVVNTFVLFLANIIGSAVDGALSRGSDRRGRGIGFYAAYWIAQLVLGFFATMIVRWFSRYREFRADEGAAKLSSPEKMIAALEKLKGAHSPTALPEKMATMGIRGGSGGFLKSLMSTHPPLDTRINRLRAATRG